MVQIKNSKLSSGKTKKISRAYDMWQHVQNKTQILKGQDDFTTEDRSNVFESLVNTMLGTVNMGAVVAYAITASFPIHLSPHFFSVHPPIKT